MKVLLDTHTLLWGLSEADKLSPAARRTIASAETLWSVVSIWETLIKVQLGKLPIPVPAGDYLVSKLTANGVHVLPLKLEHVLRVERLPMHHRDPFDRVLIAQCIEEGWPIVTADPAFHKYPIRVIW